MDDFDFAAFRKKHVKVLTRNEWMYRLMVCWIIFPITLRFMEPTHGFSIISWITTALQFSPVVTTVVLSFKMYGKNIRNWSWLYFGPIVAYKEWYDPNADKEVRAFLSANMKNLYIILDGGFVKFKNARAAVFFKMYYG